ncbi:MAG: GDP-mannose 4,6-dehydratase, partial [Spirulinaceae cyanobacterium]
MATHIVTGVAGFIASHLAETLLRKGDRVIGIDQFNDYYDTK